MAFLRASCKCCFPGKATLPASQEKGSFVIRLRPCGLPRNPNVRRYRREITLGKVGFTVATVTQGSLVDYVKGHQVWLPHGNTNLDPERHV